MFGFGQQPKRLITRSRSAQQQQPQVKSQPVVNSQAVQRVEAKIAIARRAYQDSGEPAHWNYLQQCIDELEKVLRGE